MNDSLLVHFCSKYHNFFATSTFCFIAKVAKWLKAGFFEGFLAITPPFFNI